MFNDNQDINDVNGTVAGGSGCSTSSGRRRVYCEASQVVNQRNPHHNKNKKHIKIATWNIRSMKEIGKQQLLCEELDRLNIDLVGLSETFLPEYQEYPLRPTKLNNRTYTLIHGPCNTQSRKGVAFLIDRNLRDQVQRVCIEKDFLIGVSINNEKSTTSIIQVYMPDISAKKEEVQIAYESLKKMIDKLKVKGKINHIVIMGDFNGRIGEERIEGVCGNFGSNTMNRNGRLFTEFCNEQRYKIMNTFKSVKRKNNYSWKDDHGNGQSLIDYICINKSSSSCITKCKTIHKVDKLSDHYPVVAKLKFKLKRYQKSQKIRKHANRHWLQEYDNALRYQKEMEKKEISSEPKWYEIKKVIMETTESTIPKKQMEKRKTWMTEEILTLMQKRRLEKDQKVIRQHTKVIRRKCREAKTKELLERCSKIEELEKRGDTRTMYYEVKKLAPKKMTYSRKEVEDKNGNIIYDKDKVLLRWKEYMECLYGSSQMILDNKQEIDAVELGKDQVMEVIRNLKNNKAPGLDGIPIELIKNGSEIIKDKIVNLIQRIYNGEEIPEEWLEMQFVPIAKKSNTLKCEEHRTIALIPHVMKILSKVMYERISSNLLDKIDPLQYGFRPKVGTIESVTMLKTALSNRLNLKKDTVLCFIDFVKAFDRVELSLLFKTLQNRGVHNREISLLSEIYTRQKAYMIGDAEKTQEITIKRGVRQGCILSPVLFNTYVDEAFKELEEEGVEISSNLNIHHVCYADDTVILAENEEDLNRYLNKLSDIGKKYSIEINKKKTKSMLVTSKGHKTIKIKIGDDRIEQVTKFQYPGVLLDENLNHKTDIR